MSELLTSLKAELEETKRIRHEINEESGLLYLAPFYIFRISILEEQIKALEKRALDMKGFEALLNEFEKRAIEHAESGGGHPADIPLKEADYKEIRAELLVYVNGLI